jgi:hypothetical protein
VKGQGEPAWIQVVRAEVLLRPGQGVDFEVRALDSKGRALGTRKADWKLDRLSGSLDAGRFEPAGDAPFQAGEVTASVGGLTTAARVRVVSDLPWAEDFEALDAGTVPPHWVGAPKKWEVREHAGGRVLVKLLRPKGLLRNALYMGPSTMSDYTIEADVMGAQKGRRRTDVGVIANGYTLDLMGNHQRIQLRTWPSEERVATEVPYAWEMGKWYHMKLCADVDGERALVRGKVWPRGEEEPAAWTITVEDPYPIESGSPGLVAYSPADAFFDNIKVTVNER